MLKSLLLSTLLMRCLASWDGTHDDDSDDVVTVTIKVNACPNTMRQPSGFVVRSSYLAWASAAVAGPKAIRYGGEDWSDNGIADGRPAGWAGAQWTGAMHSGGYVAAAPTGAAGGYGDHGGDPSHPGSNTNPAGGDTGVSGYAAQPTGGYGASPGSPLYDDQGAPGKPSWSSYGGGAYDGSPAAPSRGPYKYINASNAVVPSASSYANQPP